MLIGADLFWDVICRGQIALGRNAPILQNTKFGWIVSGPLSKGETNEIYCNLSRINPIDDDENIQDLLKRFWEIEECLSDQPKLSEEEVACEEHFRKNTRQCKNGAFVVKLPLKLDASKLGDSYQQAERRFLNLERKLDQDPKYKEAYHKVMREYIDLGHMEKVTRQENVNNREYYMCHHGVVREDSLSTALRVVFDASAPSSTGYYLNHLQMVGATLQEVLFSILVRFRKHNFVIAADIAKMYRCVLVSEEDRDLQRIVWRFSPNDSLDIYQLKTVTYGTAAASFLAIRCLYELAREGDKEHPDISEIIKSGFYVDDLLTGASTVEEATRVSQQVFQVLSKGCFVLRKFYSNKQEILDWIVDDDNLSKIVEFGERGASKTLGLTWCPSSDYLMYDVKNMPEGGKTTKRTILSNSSKIFDPLGLVCPCIIQVKILLQALWLEKVSWNDALPPRITAKWDEFKSEIKYLNLLRINRHVFSRTATQFELHIFCDSSEKAFGACVYGKSTDSEGNSVVSLLVAKGKVAPLKTITLPRLELCGALLAAKLANNTSKALKLDNVKRFFWCDSTIVLTWLKTPSSKLKTFVSNRDSEIQETTSLDTWKHIPSTLNPADLISRGMKPSEIHSAKIWWHGPEFLKHSEAEWPINPCQAVNDLPDIKKNCTIFLVSKSERLELFDKYSNLTRLKRVTALLLRFIQNCKQAKENQTFGPLTSSEVRLSSDKLIKIIQHDSFAMEIECIKSNKLNPKNKLASLNPFLDSNQFLRVGGRLSNAKYAFEKKYPLILPNKHPLAHNICWLH
nr:unnamed protein product [Callosobruchus analis]